MEPVPATQFRLQKFGVSTGTPTNAKIQGGLNVARELIYRRFYFAFLTWQFTAPSFAYTIRFKLTGHLVSEYKRKWDGDQVNESPWWFSGALPGVEASTSPFTPPFEVHQRAAGTSQAFPYDIYPSPDSQVVAVSFIDPGNATPTTVYPYQVVIHPTRMVGEFDSIEFDGNVIATGSTGIGGLIQVWMGCASDARRA